RAPVRPSPARALALAQFAAASMLAHADLIAPSLYRTASVSVSPRSPNRALSRKGERWPKAREGSHPDLQPSFSFCAIAFTCPAYAPIWMRGAQRGMAWRHRRGGVERGPPSGRGTATDRRVPL